MSKMNVRFDLVLTCLIAIFVIGAPGFCQSTELESDRKPAESQTFAETADDKPTDSQMRDILSRNRKDLERLKDMFVSDKALTCVSAGVINNSDLREVELSEALKNGQITEERHKQYIALEAKANCRNLAYGTVAGKSGTYYGEKNELWFLIWLSPLNAAESKFLVYSIDGTQPSNCYPTKDTDSKAPPVQSGDYVSCARIDPHWFVTYGNWSSSMGSGIDDANLKALINIFANGTEIVFLSMAFSCVGTGIAVLFLRDRRKLAALLIPFGIVIGIIGLAVPGACLMIMGAAQ